MSLAVKISNETYNEVAAKRFTKLEWTNAAKWLLGRGMGEGDVRNQLRWHAEG